MNKKCAACRYVMSDCKGNKNRPEEEVCKYYKMKKPEVYNFVKAEETIVELKNIVAECQCSFEEIIKTTTDKRIKRKCTDMITRIQSIESVQHRTG